MYDPRTSGTARLNLFSRGLRLPTGGSGKNTQHAVKLKSMHKQHTIEQSPDVDRNTAIILQNGPLYEVWADSEVKTILSSERAACEWADRRGYKIDLVK